MPLGGYRGTGGTVEQLTERSRKQMSFESGFESRDSLSEFNRADGSKFQVRGAEGAFHCNVRFVITPFSLGSQKECYNL